MTKEELEVNIAALELLVNETADKSTDFKAQLEKAKQQESKIQGQKPSNWTKDKRKETNDNSERV